MSRDLSEILDISVAAPAITDWSDKMPFGSTSTVFYGFAPELMPFESRQSRLEPHRRLTSLTLKPHFGEAVVLDLSKCQETFISSAHILPEMEAYLKAPLEQRPRRYLLKTRKAGAPAQAKYLTADALLFFLAQEALLIGLDTAELDPANKTPDNLEFMRLNKINWLLCLNLDLARTLTRYLLIALPLSPDILGPSPCRAVLMHESFQKSDGSAEMKNQKTDRADKAESRKQRKRLN